MTHVDFSCDGQYLQCDSQKGGELLFFDTERYVTRLYIVLEVCAVSTDKAGYQRVRDTLEVAKLTRHRRTTLGRDIMSTVPLLRMDWIDQRWSVYLQIKLKLLRTQLWRARLCEIVLLCCSIRRTATLPYSWLTCQGRPDDPRQPERHRVGDAVMCVWMAIARCLG